MKYLEMKKKTLALIEELNNDSENLTDDPDIEGKYMSVTNMVMFEMARFKKIAKYLEMDVTAKQLVTLENIGDAVGYEVYQIEAIRGVRNEAKANGTVYKMLESGTAEIECFVYPERITERNAKSYEFELSADVQEIMPYAIAADLLKSDKSAEYGSIYAAEFERKLNRLDTRNQLGTFFVEGGVTL